MITCSSSLFSPLFHAGGVSYSYFSPISNHNFIYSYLSPIRSRYTWSYDQVITWSTHIFPVNFHQFIFWPSSSSRLLFTLISPIFLTISTSFVFSQYIQTLSNTIFSFTGMFVTLKRPFTCVFRIQSNLVTSHIHNNIFIHESVYNCNYVFQKFLFFD